MVYSCFYFSETTSSESKLPRIVSSEFAMTESDPTVQSRPHKRSASGSALFSRAVILRGPKDHPPCKFRAVGRLPL